MKTAIMIIVICFASLFSLNGNAQNTVIHLHSTHLTLKEIFHTIEQQTDYLVVFSNNEINVKQTVNVSKLSQTVSSCLDEAFKQTEIHYEFIKSYIILSNKEVHTTKKNLFRISGSVFNENGKPLIGVSIRVRGNNLGTITDEDGFFNLRVKNKDVIDISYVGYISHEIQINNNNTFHIILKEDIRPLSEVVVTALEIKKQKRSIGYSTTEVNGNEFTESRDRNFGNTLSGKIAGVNVIGNATGLGGSSRVIIRGNASLTGNNQPLYVIDGVQFDNSNLGQADTYGGLDMGDGLSDINPDDIDNIQVLKGAVASALYGYRGGNGAIIITTKSGKKNQEGVGIEFNNNLTFSSIYDCRDFQKTYGQGTRNTRPTDQSSAYQTYNLSWGEMMDGTSFVNRNGNIVPYRYVDNWKNFYRTGIDESASVAVSGKTGYATYRIGLSDLSTQSILPNANSDQQGINLNTIFDITKQLHVSLQENFTYEHINGRSNLSDSNGNTNAALLYLANAYDVRWIEGNKGANEDGTELQPGNSVYFNNPYWLQYRKTNTSDKKRLTGALTFRYDFANWLYAQAQVTHDGYILDFKQVQPNGAAADPDGFIDEYEKNFTEINLNYLIGVNKKLKDFTFSGNLGGNRLYNICKQYGTNGDIHSFVIDGLYSSSNIYLGKRTFAKGYTEYRVNSVYGMAELSYKDWLFLNFTGRKDWFSTLNPSNNNYFYPSVSLSWMVSDCLKLPNWITSLKLRTSMASASNGTSPYQTQLTYTLSDFNIQGQSMGYIKNTSVPNTYLKPVRISEQEIGLNTSFLNNRIGFDLAFYNKKTTDDIAKVTTSEASGFTSAYKNIGKIRNQGLELMLFGVPITARKTKWNLSFNISYNKSKVLYLGKDVSSLTIEGASSRNGNATIRNIVGQSYGQIVGYTYKTDSNKNRVYSPNGLPIRSNDVSVLGNGVYKWTGGLHNDFTYKNFRIAFLLDFKWGAKIFSGTNYNLYNSGLQKATLNGRKDGVNITGVDEEGNSFSKKGINAQTYWQWISTNDITEEFVYNASFIKLREFSIGYSFPKSLLDSHAPFIKNLNISLVGRNLWTIIKYTPNIDPESAYNSSNGQGLELNGYPATRSIGFNLNIKF